MNRPHLVLAGGGTGGHLYPGIAVAAAVRRREPDARITFFTTTRELDRKLLTQAGFDQVEQPVLPFSLKPWDWPRFWLAWRRSRSAALRFLRRERVSAVLGLGGYAAGPAVVAARSAEVRGAILNPDAIPGRANRHLARYVDLVALQWERSHVEFSPAVTCRVLGCPIRADFARADGAEGRRRFGLAPDRPVLLVTGASQGARTVNEAVTRVWAEFCRARPEWQLLHLTGPADEASVRAAYAAQAAPAQVVAFTHEMWLALAAADLVISRAGASTLAELTVLGKPSILMPYPFHRDRHQHANAQVLVEAGAAELVDDARAAAANAPPLAAALERCCPPETRAAMGAAAARLGRPGAAEAVAEWLMNAE